MSTTTPISPLRRRMIEDMTVRGFGEKTQSDYIRHVKNFTIASGEFVHDADVGAKCCQHQVTKSVQTGNAWRS